MCIVFCFCKQKTAYEMRISDWSSDVCSSDLLYLFTVSELEDYIADKTLKSKTGTHGASRGTLYVSKHQCGQLRQRIGFTPEEAARRVGVTVERFEKQIGRAHV